MRPAWLVLALSLAVACAAPADVAPDAARLGPLLDVVARAPALAAARQRVAAAQARTGSAARLPDPEIEAMGSRVNADAMGENRDMWELNLRQPLPKRGERAADRARAAAAVGAAEAEFALGAADLAAEVALALAEAEAATDRTRLLHSQLDRLQAGLRALDTRLAAGIEVRLADRLTLQSRVASLQFAIERARQSAADAAAGARSRLALAPDAPLPAFAAPAPSEIDAADFAAIAVAQARGAEASALGRMARASAQPMTSVGLRFERERSSMGNQDTVGLAFSSELPFRARHYARAEVRAAEADRAAAGAEAVAARHRVAATLTRADRAERLAATARRLAAETDARLAAEHEILARAVSVAAPSATALGSGSAVLHAVDILDQTTETQLGILEAETAARTARAELWRFLPTARLLRLLPQPPPPRP
jgi:cobalt-zinc-cadmium efflux system outer membrane protein